MTVSGKTTLLAEIEKVGFLLPMDSINTRLCCGTSSYIVNRLLLGTGSVRFLLVGRHVFSTPIFGLLLDLEGHRAKGLQVRHTLSTSYSALVGQLFQPN